MRYGKENLKGETESVKAECLMFQMKPEGARWVEKKVNMKDGGTNKLGVKMRKNNRVENKRGEGKKRINLKIKRIFRKSERQQNEKKRKVRLTRKQKWNSGWDKNTGKSIFQ